MGETADGDVDYTAGTHAYRQGGALEGPRFGGGLPGRHRGAGREVGGGPVGTPLGDPDFP